MSEIKTYRQLFNEKWSAGENILRRGVDDNYHQDLIQRLNIYENEFIRRAENDPNASENLLDSYGLFASGLTQEGLCKARFLAGKRPSMEPGIHILEEKFW